jgi:hypothetical protein
MYFKTTLIRCALFFFLCIPLFLTQAFSQAAPVVTGELKKWHNVTLTFTGPSSSETATPNPFLDYRMVVIFSNGSKSYAIPGYFAADGNAANSSATSGDKWRVHFVPTATGQWTWEAYFHEGSQIALDTDLDNGTPVSFNGQTGTLTIGATDKSGRDLRGKGMLQYVGGHYLRFAETGEYFVKGGADSPENFLNYADFDNSANSGGFRKTWSPHVSDWQTGDPTWKNGLGKGIIGAINYLSSKGMNVFSFLTMNTNGDDKDVFPWIVNNGSNAPQDDRTRFDCSKLDQWEVVFDHADKKGMYLHFKLQEIENDRLLDDGQLGVERKVYYRELIARFGHHLALNWNLGEEYDAYISLNDSQQLLLKSFAQYIRDTDPYKHHIVVHTWPGQQNAVYTPMLGTSTELTGVSIQTNFNQVHQLTLEWRNKSVQAGKPWVVANDEQGSATTGVTPDGTGNNHTNIRRFTLWGNLMAGGAGVEYYFGYNYPQSDLTCEDFRSRDNMWDQTRYALDFFTTQLPFWQMANYNSLVSNFLNSNTNYCFAKPGETYVVYAPTSIPFLDLQNFNDTFDVQWFNPRTGGALQNGSIAFVVGPGFVNLGTPPSGSTGDWVALVKSRNVAPVLTPPVIDLSQPANGAQFYFNQNVSIAASASDPGGNVTQVQFFNGSALIQTVTAAPYTLNWTPPGPGAYQIKAVATDNDGLTARDSANITVLPNQPPVQQIAQPQPGASFNYNQLVQFTVTANDPDNGVSLVTFLVNGSVVQTFTAPPYTLDWVPSGPGAYSFKSIAADPLGLTDADSVSFTILPNQAPLVAFSQPVNGDSFAYNQQVNLAASASDPDGLVDSVRFFLGGNLLQAIGAAPYSLVWSPSGPGVYTFYVTATDTSGLVATDSVTITVLPNQPPLLSFTQPLNGANTPFNQPVSVSVTASDPDGLVDSVRIFEGNTLLQAFGTGPYGLLWMPPTSGTYVIKAIATDNTGLATVDSVTFTVLPNQPPVAQFSSPDSGTQATIGIPINLSATASDPDANLAGVFYSVNGTLVDSAFSSPFDVSWTPANLGLRTVIVTAFDSLGLTGADTIQVNVVANQPPVVSWQQPVNLTQVPLLQPVTLTATASDPDGTVTQVQFFVGGAPLFTDTQAPFTTTWTPVVSGNYSLVAIATDNQGETSNAVISVNVASNLNPLVDITQPLAGATLPQGQPVTVSASASDPDGTVAQVAYFVNGTLFQTVTSAPYSTSWTPASTGTFTLRAVVTDNLGATGVDSVAVTVVGNTPPIVVITTPINGFVAPMGIQVRFTATATDPNGTISKVEFFRNGVFFTLQQVAPYTAFWTPAAPGTYTIVAVGTDNQGATGSDTITVVVPNQPPVVDITQPANNTSRPVGLPFTISATASDPDGTVAQVAFFRGNVLISTDIGSPFSAVWNPSTPGPVQLIAVATDNFGATRSDTVNITVTANQSPVVAFTQPANGASLTINQPIAMNVTASDPDGSVVRVEFYNGTTLLNTDVSPPFAFNWTAPAVGAYTLRAIAYDNVNNSATATVNVTVVANQPPTVALTQPSNLGPFLANRPINLQATASDTDGSVVSVTFLVNGAPILVDATSPYAATFTPTQPGNYTILARALDNNGATSSSSVVITVVPNPAPVVTITQPASNINVLTGTPVNVQFTVTDQDNNVTGIGLFRNGTQVQTFTGSGPYSHSWTPLTAGTYTYIAVATDAGANVSRDTVVVTAVVVNPPTVQFLNPLNQLSIKSGLPAPVSITAASNGVGTISQVVFRVGNTVQNTFTQPPYTTTWTPPTNGAYNLFAIATDNFGQTRRDSIRVFAVPNQAPVVDLVQPLNNANVIFGQPVTIQATATDPDGTVASVALQAGSTTLQTFSTGPFQTTWTPPAPGFYVIRARATDNNGAVSIDSATIQVANFQPPVVQFVSPVMGGTVPFGQTATVQVNANDPDGTVQEVRFFQGTTLLQTQTAPPYTFSWTPPTPGAYNLIARALDSQGLWGRDSIRVNAVPSNTPPVIAIQTPTANQTLALGVPTQVLANITDPGGAVAQVQLFINGVQVQSFTQSPYSFTWTPNATGATRVTFRATDNLGAVRRDSVWVNVILVSPPSIAFLTPVNQAAVKTNLPNPIQIQASSSGSTVTQVVFRVGSTVMNTFTQPPYTTTWTPPTNGAYNLIAIATNSFGMTSRDSIRVFSSPNQPPLVDLTQPLNGQSVLLGQSASIQATASDPDGTLASVVFSANGTTLQTFTSGPFQLNWTPSVAGTYVVRARATDNNGTVSTDSATITVAAFLPPVVQFTQPLNGQFINGGQPFVMSANASDPDGTITRVDFFTGNQLVFSDTQAPYTTTWVPTMAGAYNLRAVAWDSQGLSRRDSIRVNVGNFVPPVVQFTTPLMGSIITVGQPASLQVNASDPDGAVQEVRFFNGNTLIQTVTAPPYAITWTPPSFGAYNLIARALDAQGLWARDSIRVMAQNPNTPPVIQITAPTAGQVLAAGTPTQVSANVTDPGGSVVQVRVFVNGVQIQSFTQAPYSFTWTPTTPGTNRVRFSATDNQGATTVDSVVVTVNNFLPPVVQFTSPLAGGTIFLGTNNVLSATASDPDGTIAEVRFFNGTTLLQTVTSPPFTATFNPTVPGSYSLIVRAFDNQGLTSRDSIRVTAINNPAAPQVSFITPSQGQSVPIGTPINIQASVTIASGTISSVSFFNGNSLIQTLTAPPYQVSWTAPTAGAYNLRVQALGSNGLTGLATARVFAASSFTGTDPGDTESTLTPAPQSELMLFPNPAQQEVVLSLPDHQAELGRGVVSVFALDGKRVFEIDLEWEPGQKQIPLDISPLVTGSYLISVDSGGTRSLGRLVKID